MPIDSHRGRVDFQFLNENNESSATLHKIADGLSHLSKFLQILAFSKCSLSLLSFVSDSKYFKVEYFVPIGPLTYLDSFYDITICHSDW